MLTILSFVCQQERSWRKHRERERVRGIETEGGKERDKPTNIQTEKKMYNYRRKRAQQREWDKKRDRQADVEKVRWKKASRQRETNTERERERERECVCVCFWKKERNKEIVSWQVSIFIKDLVQYK